MRLRGSSNWDTVVFIPTIVLSYELVSTPDSDVWMWVWNICWGGWAIHIDWA